MATFGSLKTAFVDGARVLDVRDQNEIDAGKGGKCVSNAVRVPMNMNGESQETHQTSIEEYAAALTAAGVDLNNPSTFVVHCTGGGRANKACEFLEKLGFTALNGGSPAVVTKCYEEAEFLKVLRNLRAVPVFKRKPTLFKFAVTSSAKPGEL